MFLVSAEAVMKCDICAQRWRELSNGCGISWHQAMGEHLRIPRLNSCREIEREWKNTSGYQVYTNLEGEENRKVAIYISNTIDPLVMEVKSDTNYTESVWLKVALRRNHLYCQIIQTMWSSPDDTTWLWILAYFNWRRLQLRWDWLDHMDHFQASRPPKSEVSRHMQLVERSEKWQLQFNFVKCKVLHLGRNNRCLAYKMGDIELHSTKVEKDLGVYVVEELKFHQHISFAVNKSSRMMWLIKKHSHV